MEENLFYPNSKLHCKQKLFPSHLASTSRQSLECTRAHVGEWLEN